MYRRMGPKELEKEIEELRKWRLEQQQKKDKLEGSDLECHLNPQRRPLVS